MKYLAKTTDAVSSLEIETAALSRRAASEGIVLLKNDGVLPLPADGRSIALFGSGARKTVKGGSGSGDVNTRYQVTVEQGLENAGYRIVTKAWLERYDALYEQDIVRWKEELDRVCREEGKSFVFAYLETRHLQPADLPVLETDLAEAQTAVYVVGRRSGEGVDRFSGEGDFCLSAAELEGIRLLTQRYPEVILVINAGGPVNLAPVADWKGLRAIVNLSQAGIEGGNALADMLTGRAVPSGKLADTWARAYLDYPRAAAFSDVGGNPDRIVYEEGIYVGYRYFEEKEIEPLYPFGYGLSYADLRIYPGQAACCGDTVSVTAAVENADRVYEGREVVQLYCAQPAGSIPKARKVLAAFAKTRQLRPGERQELTLACTKRDLASYDTEQAAWVLEPGAYRFYLGNSSADCSLVGEMTVETREILEQLRPFSEKEPERTAGTSQGTEPGQDIGAPDRQDPLWKRLEQFADEELVRLVVGASPETQRETVGNAAQTVVGAAGETARLEGIPPMVLADGGAGVRLTHHFHTDQDGNLIGQHPMEALEGGLFVPPAEIPEGSIDYYQYCTAFPCGTMLAQTWNEELLYEVGQGVSREMKEFGAHLWLAPSMNIHRNPLCGRNFEYYSEDPLLTGRLVSAVCRGVQSDPATGATIKHFACNDQELHRFVSDSVVAEQPLREIYLRAFEMVVKTAAPAALMTSYNLLNGVHTANSYGLCTQVLRGEWGFQGMVMTDWGTTDPGDSVASVCIKHGNDLVMPGTPGDREEILEALQKGTLLRNELLVCAWRIASTALRLNGMTE